MTSHHDHPPAVRKPRPEGDRRPELPGAETAPPTPSAEVDDLRRALAEAEDRYLRLAADFDNFKRRKGQELIDSSRYASEDAVRGLLPVLDNLRRAVAHAPEAGAEEFFVNGLELVVREFETALERLGVTKIPAVGEPFDPAVHNAIGGEESADVDSDIVSQELVPGYRLHDRLIRPAMVRVAHPSGASSAG